MILLCCDGAAWHKSGSLCIPENIRLFFIPPYTPEMNPIEQIWKDLRKRGFRNEVFATLEKVVDRLCDTICALTTNAIRSIAAGRVPAVRKDGRNHRGNGNIALKEGKGDGNPHANILLTTRPLDSSGRWMDKQHRNYLLDKNGERIFDPIKGQYKLGRSIKTHDWDDPDRVQEWRAGWANACNEQFRQYGIDKEVTCLSYAEQGIEREPTKHLGAKVRAMESRGILTDRGNDNRRIIADRQRQDRQHFRQRMKQNRTRSMERDLEHMLDIELSR